MTARGSVSQTTNESRDLGFGSVLARESRARLLNRDGSFNARREGLPFFRSLSLYHSLLTMTWPRFLLMTVGAYVLVNCAFALGYFWLGSGALTGAAADDPTGRFLEVFFFSVHTLATIGYGNVSPASLGANLLVTIESFVGLVGFSMIAGIVFARVSRPTAGVVFSQRAVIGPYRGKTALMFRLTNIRRNELFQVTARVYFSWKKPGEQDRQFFELELERRDVMFLALTWTVVHPIDEQSPIFGVSEAELHGAEAELFVLLTATEEAFSQTVHARVSYTGQEIIMGARFVNIIEPPRDDGIVHLNVTRINELERVAL